MVTTLGRAVGRRRSQLAAGTVVLVIAACTGSDTAEPLSEDAPATTDVVNTLEPRPSTTPATDRPSTIDDGSEDMSTAFVEDFSGNTGLERFDYDVYHRDDYMVTQTEWSGDHDENCGTPDTQRTIHRDSVDESFYLCVDHLMTSVGDTSGYSIAWFSPREVFHAGVHTQVSFDVNVTDLGNRKWWEVSIVPDGAPYLATIDWVAETAEISTYDDRSIVVGSGPFAGDSNVTTNGEHHAPLDWHKICDEWSTDPEACDSKAIRRPFSITDNRDGTVTIEYLGERYTYDGEFPESFRVYFKDHSYTPLKDGPVAGLTWHWDNIVVR